MAQTTALINAITGLAWPVIVGLVIWRLFPSIKQIVESRGFTVKVGNAELSVQQISEKLLETTASIQDKLATVDTTTPQTDQQLRKVLWVDDNPANNAYEMAQLEKLGVQIVSARSTAEGVAALFEAAPAFDAVISDLNRRESGSDNPDAGLDLIRQIREQGSAVPILVFAGRRGLALRTQIKAAGGTEVATSSTELFSQLRALGSFPNGGWLS
jgi:CheY-like chemotaxis protein